MLSPRGHAAVPVASAAVLIAVAPIAGWAQTPPSSSQSYSRTPIGQDGVVSYRPATLQSLLDKVDWDADVRGALLIVAPDKTTQVRAKPRPKTGDVFSRGGALKLPEPNASGRYRLANLGDYFGRRLVPVGDRLTVFAPATMSVLATRLPKPDPYAGMGPNAKLRLLQSTLTKAQWRKIGGADGIGVGDLDEKQQPLFLSLLPEPFTVQPTRRNDNGQRVNYVDYVTNPDITLTAAERRAVRLSLRRALSWDFSKVGDPNFRMSIGVGGEDDGAAFELRGNGFGSDFTGNDDTVLGLRLLDEVPNRPKPGQLPFAWSALDAPVSLSGAATVGELVKRAATQTRVELFCDPRYADLAVYTRGDGSVRAGDLLSALSQAVTGTFRKVGANSYVMTDDLEGLGTRHARLQAWAQASAALAQNRSDEVEAALARASIGDYVEWSASDTGRPSDALAQKIEAHRRKWSGANPLPAPSGVKIADQLLIIPVSELPPSAQEMVKRQIESVTRNPGSQSADPFFVNRPAMQTDRVLMDVQVRASFVVPGKGVISSQGMSVSSNASQSLTPLRPYRTAAAPQASEPIAVPASYSTRALLIAPRSADEATRAVRAAQAHGINQIWVEPPIAGDGKDNGDAAALNAAVAAGKAAGIPVGAVVRVLRPGAKTAADATASTPDRNIAGETATEWAARRRGAPFAPSPYGPPAVAPGQEAEQLLKRGDWLTPDEPSVQAAAIKRAALVAQTPGISGIALRDVAAPGYNGDTATDSFSNISDGAERMGYTEGARLAFLREAGVDPVDLTPLSGGMIDLPFSFSSSFSSMQLPFFTDYGIDPRKGRFNGQSATDLGAKDSPERWAAFRKAKSDALAQSVVKTIRAERAALPVWIQWRTDTFNPYVSNALFEPWVDPATPAPTQTQAQNSVGGKKETAPPPRTTPFLFTVRCAALPDDVPTTDMPSARFKEAENDFRNRLAVVMNRALPGCGGVLLDLSDIPLDRALSLLNALKPQPRPTVASGARR